MPELTKISIERSGELNRIPTNITAAEGKKKLLAAGWELVRTGNHQVFKKDNEVLTISSTGTMSPWLTQLVYRACAKTITRRSSTNQPIPLMVKYKNRSWGVIEKRGDNFLLVDLAMGNKVEALTIECVAIRPEDIAPPPPPREEKPQIVAPPPPPPPPPVIGVEEAPRPSVPVASSFRPPRPEYFDRPVQRTVPVVEPEKEMAEDDEFAAWVKYTERFVASYTARIEALLAEAAALELEQKGFKDMLEASRKFHRGVALPAPPPAPEPRRTILPPTGPKRSTRVRGKAIPPWEIDRIASMYSQEHLSVSEIASHLDRAPSVIYRHINKLKEEGRIK